MFDTVTYIISFYVINHIETNKTCSLYKLHIYRLDGQVCPKIGVVDPLFSIEWSTTPRNSYPEQWDSYYNNYILGVVNLHRWVAMSVVDPYFILCCRPFYFYRMVDNTKEFLPRTVR